MFIFSQTETIEIRSCEWYDCFVHKFKSSYLSFYNDSVEFFYLNYNYSDLRYYNGTFMDFDKQFVDSFTYYNPRKFDLLYEPKIISSASHPSSFKISYKIGKIDKQIIYFSLQDSSEMIYRFAYWYYNYAENHLKKVPFIDLCKLPFDQLDTTIMRNIAVDFPNVIERYILKNMNINDLRTLIHSNENMNHKLVRLAINNLFINIEEKIENLNLTDSEITELLIISQEYKKNSWP